MSEATQIGWVIHYPPDIHRIASLVTKFGRQKVEKAVLLSWIAGTLEVHPFTKAPAPSDVA
jgi:hypothetical protein